MIFIGSIGVIYFHPYFWFKKKKGFAATKTDPTD